MAKNNQAPVAPVDSDSETVAPEVAAAETLAAEPSELRKILLLVDCAAGKCAQVVELLVHEAEALVKSGHADDHPAAVAAHEG